MLLSVGFLISEDLIAVLWIRCNPAHKLPLQNLTASSILPNKACSYGGSRHHLSPMVGSRIKELCNELGPRDVDGVMLGDGSVCGEKRLA
jgi:hypothetical protein